jgi:hypothetical protein
MPRIGIAITKSVAFRNSTQEFSNVYYYEGVTLPTSTEAATLMNSLVAIEKTFHSTAVTFVRAKLWSQTGSQSTNQMINQITLSGTGARTTANAFDKERAFLFRLRAGNDSRGNPVYLRKWFHACGILYSGQTIQTAWLDQSAGFGSTERGTMETAISGIGEITGPGGPWKLCAKSGRQPDAGATWRSHDFLEHHQLGDMWRGS